MKKVLMLLLCFLLIIQSASQISYAAAAETGGFGDVPEGHWAETDIYGLLERGITNGVSPGRFGLGNTLTRGEFTAFLVRIMGWTTSAGNGGFEDVDTDKWYAPYIETAARKGATSENSIYFRPEENITREEMAVMIVNTLGYSFMLGRLNLTTSFPDVGSNADYIEMAKDFGIITGYTDGRFDPDGSASREQAAAMLMRMIRRLEGKTGIEKLHAFYAVSSSGQADFINRLDEVSMGWARLEYKDGSAVLNTTMGGGNEYGVPNGYERVVNLATQAKTPMNLMIFVNEQDIDGVPLASKIINDETLRTETIDAIAAALAGIETADGTLEGVFSGVVMDFELLRVKDKAAYTEFLRELDERLDEYRLIVAVHPAARPGLAYYDGYDFKAIGDIADAVILMAHDYNAKSLTESEMASGYTNTPLSPINDVYYALKAITDPKTGVADKEKIMLQISFDSCQWKLDPSGRVINGTAYRPGYDAIYSRLIQNDVEITYGDSKNPRAGWIEADGTKNVLWYEDTRSVGDKTELAQMFGINAVSLWRLGNIPDFNSNTGTARLDVWDVLTNNK